MSSHVDLLEIECDAPSYPIVRACRRLGMESPEDVRWARLSRFRYRHHGWMGRLARRTFGALFGRRDPAEESCSCGHTLPELELYAFTFRTGEELEYAVGQCPCCRSIYWDEA